jgi:hypothetical protein
MCLLRQVQEGQVFRQKVIDDIQFRSKRRPRNTMDFILKELLRSPLDTVKRFIEVLRQSKCEHVAEIIETSHDSVESTGIVISISMFIIIVVAVVVVVEFLFLDIVITAVKRMLLHL